MKPKAQYAIEKEIREIEKIERKMEKAALRDKDSIIIDAIENKIPIKLREGINSAFFKAFDIVLDKGHYIIEKSIDKKQLVQDQNIRNYALKVKKGRKEWRKIHKSALRSDLVNMTISTVEGIGLGLLGIGLPDIVLFLSSILRGVYEIALNYGFEYESRKEQLFILRIMEASLSKNEAWRERNRSIDQMFDGEETEITQEMFAKQLRATADAFAMDMLILKFIQGLPVVGVIGGAANPFYYKKVCDYAKLKYRQRHFKRHLASEANTGIINLQ